MDFSSDFSGGKWKNSYKMASKSSKMSVEVNSRLHGRSEILQQFTFFEKVDQLSTFLLKKSNGSLSMRENSWWNEHGMNDLDATSQFSIGTTKLLIIKYYSISN